MPAAKAAPELPAPDPFDLLRVATPARWIAAARSRWQDLLLDHANCEKKAASTALSLIFTYADDAGLAFELSRLAREELRHFEQVQRMLTKLQVPYRRVKPGRYAETLRRAVRPREPGRRLDLLICGALIEARSCERFMALAPQLDEPLGMFYAGLADAEARHFTVYLQLAARSGGEEAAREINRRSRELAQIEAQLIEEPDAQFRFHSGVPVDLAE
ncbi:MAG TPA: tRNA-(ms[2]io[6]A)-hydroxylase [Steroidobacteraceae bacterium]|nr:tRNA-(ms[2]io[6]A)-hydroxylase [Steroidobacteraceae bacterium]